jgi:hypothetical protein
MKKTVCSFAMLAVFAVVLTGFSPAQDDTYRVAAHIPFDFYAGDIKLPSGHYLFDVSYGNHSVTLRNRDTGQAFQCALSASSFTRVWFVIQLTSHVLPPSSE